MRVGGVTSPETNGASSLNPLTSNVSDLDADLTAPNLPSPSKASVLASSGLVNVLKDEGQVEATTEDRKLRRVATRAIPEEDRRRIVEWGIEVDSWRRAAKMYGLGKDTVWDWARKFKVKLRPRE